ncbi:MAG: RNA-binding S4 domain-containing protein [Flavobacteriaceae bacterium]|jgi:ribosome-associated heat shock protein Hsp15|nr:RNA-binding S4 domain-containing protein [Flavobacteriaceae bacterium]
MRIDQYLWCLRYYKSRNQASLACKQGHVRFGDQIVKPSREVLIGDKVKVRKNQIWHELKVMDIPKSRLGAKLVDIYRENTTPQEVFDNADFQSLSKGPHREKGTGRPTKKDRREIDGYFEDPDQTVDPKD